MEFEFVTYKNFKIGYLFKYNKLLFIFNGARLNSKNWLLVEQSLNVIKLNYYKIYNISSNAILQNSIYKNNGNLSVNGSTLFITFDKFANINLTSIQKLLTLHPLLIYLSTKLNNKIYSTFQIRQVNCIVYNNNQLMLCYLLKTTIKKLYKQKINF